MDEFPTTYGGAGDGRLSPNWYKILKLRFWSKRNLKAIMCM
jgi:hypothetical protein